MTPSQEKYQQQRLAFADFIKLYPFTTEDLDGEEWRLIEGYEGYQISNYGRVKSFKNNMIKILRPKLEIWNYLIVRLSKNDVIRAFKVHRLVAKAFIPNPDNKPQVNHIDGCKMNACASNLEWTTARENTQHAYDTGLSQSGADNYQAKLNNEQVLYIRENPDNLSIRELATVFKVSPSNIYNVIHGRTYKKNGGSVCSGEYKSTAKKPPSPKRTPEPLRVRIRAEYIKGDKEFGITALARKYGLDRNTVMRIVHEEFAPTKQQEISDEVRNQIRTEYVKWSKTHGTSALAKKYGVGASTVWKIANKK